jgi:hypothetical protein
LQPSLLQGTISSIIIILENSVQNEAYKKLRNQKADEKHEYSLFRELTTQKK